QYVAVMRVESVDGHAVGECCPDRADAPPVEQQPRARPARACGEALYGVVADDPRQFRADAAADDSDQVEHAQLRGIGHRRRQVGEAEIADECDGAVLHRVIAVPVRSSASPIQRSSSARTIAGLLSRMVGRRARARSMSALAMSAITSASLPSACAMTRPEASTMREPPQKVSAPSPPTRLAMTTGSPYIIA